MRSLLLVLFSSAMLATFGAVVKAADPAETAEPLTETEALAFESYHAALVQRAASPEALANQPLAVAEALGIFSGHTLVQASCGAIAWNSAIGNVEIWQDNESVTLSYYVDEHGRPAFAGEELQGVIDVNGSQVYLEVYADGKASFWLGPITLSVDENGQPQATLFFTNTTKCVCKGSNNECEDPQNDCAERAPCTYTNNSGSHNSNCEWHKVPEGGQAAPLVIPQ